jgi:predicted O-methyltransferase YrrM
MHHDSGFREIMQKAGLFRESMILFAAVELDLFSCLEEEPQQASELAARLGCDSLALEILLDALVAMKFLTKSESYYANMDKSSIFLSRQSESYRGAILRHLHHNWSLWGQLTETIKKGSPSQAAESFLHSEKKANRDYIWGMDNVGQDRARAICTVLDLSDRERMLDLGSGAATYSLAFLRKFPKLKITLFDLPISLSVARENVEKNGMQSRVVFREGDFFKTDFGNNYDTVWISQILHGHSRARCRELIEKSYTALKSGGMIAIHDFFVDNDKTSPYHAVLFSVHMLAVTENGCCYSGSELMDWLRQVGFTDIHSIRVDEQSSLVRGTKPAE